MLAQPSVYNLHGEYSYEGGTKIGFQKQYFTNGRLMYESFLVRKDSNHQKYYKEYSLNGRLSEEVYPHWGKKYYETGELLASWGSRNYIIIGEYKELYSNGSIKMKVNYIDGDRDGLMYKYFEDGLLKELWSYNKGKRIFVRKFYKCGNLKTEWLYDNDGTELSKIYYDKKGNLMTKTHH